MSLKFLTLKTQIFWALLKMSSPSEPSLGPITNKLRHIELSPGQALAWPMLCPSWAQAEHFSVKKYFLKHQGNTQYTTYAYI